MAGIIHPYYVVVLAPPIAALVGLGGRWRGGTGPGGGPAAPGGRRGGDGGVGVRAAAAHAVVAAVVGVDGRWGSAWSPWWGCWWRAARRGARRGRARVAWWPGWRTDRRTRSPRPRRRTPGDPVGGAVGRHGAGWRSAGGGPAAAGRRRPLGAGQAAPDLARRARRAAARRRDGRRAAAATGPGWTGWLRRPAGELDAVDPGRCAPAARRGRVHLGRGGRRLEHRGGLPARNAAAGDGGRRVQRHRPLPHARAVPGARRGEEDPLVRGGGAGSGPGRRAAAATPPPRSPLGCSSTTPPTTVGGDDPVRPVRSGVVSTPVASTAGAQVDHKDPTARADIVVTMSVDTAPNPEMDPAPHGTGPRRGRARLQRGDRPGAVGPPPARVPVRRVPLPLPHHDRRQRQRRRHARDRGPPRRRSCPRSSRCGCRRRAAAGRCGRHGPRPTRRCSPTATWTSPPTSPRCCRWSPR